MNEFSSAIAPPHQIDDVPAATAEQQFTIAPNEVLRPNAFAFHKK
jgi:hypothetical protein